MVVDEQTIHPDQTEKPILAYDYSTRRKSPYKVKSTFGNGTKGYAHPRPVFGQRHIVENMELKNSMTSRQRPIHRNGVPYYDNDANEQMK